MPSLHRLVFLLPLLPLSFAAVNGPCSIDGTPGVCVTTGDCAAQDGSFRSGFCPNDPASIKCCIKPECGSGGNCRPANTCGGTTKTGLCPGGTDFLCCEASGTTPPPPPPPPPSGGGGATTDDLKLSENGVNFIMDHEKFEPNYYLDPVGVRTIGYGHACQTAGECPDPGPITEARAKELLLSDAVEFEQCVNADVTVALNQNQFDALISFAFNLGCGPVARIAEFLNVNDFAGATSKMLEFNKGSVNGQLVTLPGLVTRREDEVALFNS